jgi:hypothetical protein
MNRAILKISILFFIGVFVLGCEKEENIPAEISGQLISNTQCKDFFKSASEGITTPDSLSCIEYTFNQTDSTLTLKHINAGFNCCPELLSCEVTASGDTLIIEEFEKSALCDCNCLYDLDIVINGVLDKQYKIKMVEPYARDQEELFLEIDLSVEVSGSFCVLRKRYPWGIHGAN